MKKKFLFFTAIFFVLVNFLFSNSPILKLKEVQAVVGTLNITSPSLSSPTLTTPSITGETTLNGVKSATYRIANTGLSYQNHYLEIATYSTTTTYEDADLTGEIIYHGSMSNNIRYNFNIAIRNGTIPGTEPTIYITKQAGSKNLTPGIFVRRTSANGASPKVIKLYLFSNDQYSSILYTLQGYPAARWTFNSSIVDGGTSLSGTDVDGYGNTLLAPDGGFVGIGTTAPSTKLDVNNGEVSAEVSSTNFTQLYRDNAIIWGSGAYSGSLRLGSANDLAAGGWTEYMRVGSNVGIGTTAPETKLHIAGGDLLLSNTKIIYFESSGGTNIRSLDMDTGPNLNIGRDDNLNTIQTFGPVSLYDDAASPSKNISFDPTTNSDSYFNSGGDLGIGTTAPGDKLDVNGGTIIRDRAAIQGNGASCSAPGAGTAGWWYSDAGDCATIFVGVNNATNGSESWGVWIGNWDWYVDVNGNVTNGGNIAVNGNATLGDASTDTHTVNGLTTFNQNIGVGTAATSGYEILVAKAAENVLMRIYADTNYWAGINTEVGGNGWVFGQLGDSDIGFYAGGPGTVPVRFKPTSAVNDTLIVSAGNVGIRNTSPASLLDIGTAGSLRGTLRLNGNTSGYTIIQPSAAAGSWTMTLPGGAGTSGQQLQTNGSGTTSWAAAGSLRDMKNIIGEISPNEGLETILKTPVYRFHYKPGQGTLDTKTEYVGIMADEAPWAVHYNGTIVNPVNTLGYMILGVQELNAKNNKLQEQLTIQQKQIDELKKEIETLKKK